MGFPRFWLLLYISPGPGIAERLSPLARNRGFLVPCACRMETQNRQGFTWERPAFGL